MKKYLSLMLSFLIFVLFFCISFSSYAASNTVDKMCFSASSDYVERDLLVEEDQTAISIPVYIKNNIGIKSLGIELASTDRKFIKSISITPGNIIKDNITYEINNHNNYLITWSDSVPIRDDGLLFFVELTLSENSIMFAQGNGERDYGSNKYIQFNIVSDLLIDSNDNQIDNSLLKNNYFGKNIKYDYCEKTWQGLDLLVANKSDEKWDYHLSYKNQLDIKPGESIYMCFSGSGSNNYFNPSVNVMNYNIIYDTDVFEFVRLVGDNGNTIVDNVLNNGVISFECDFISNHAYYYGEETVDLIEYTNSNILYELKVKNTALAGTYKIDMDVTYMDVDYYYGLAAYIDVLECEHQYNDETIVNPTCENEGYSYSICNICEKKNKYNFVPALKHNYVSYKYPTFIEYICTSCGETYKELNDETQSQANAQIIIDNTKAIAGSIVQVDISIKDNPGILGAILSVSYDKNLTLINATNGSAFEMLSMTAPGKYTNPCQLSWDGLDLNSSDIKDGDILHLFFQVPNNATEGTQYSVNLSYAEGNIVDANLQPVSLNITNGKIVVGDEVSEQPSVTNPTILVKNTNSSAGATAEVIVDIKNNPGILGAILSVNYDKNLTLINATSGSAFDMLSMTTPGKYSNPCQLSWDGLDLTAEDIKDGDILHLYFKVPENAANGTEYNVNLSYVEGNIVDSSLSPVSLNIVNGIVTVSDEVIVPPSSTEPTLTIENTTSTAGSSVEVNVDIVNNPGILGAILSLSYDDHLTLVEARNGSAFSALSMTSPGKFTNPCQFSWDGLDLSPSDIKDGNILTLVFNVDEDVSAGSELNIELNYNDGNIVDYNLNTVSLQINNGKIVIEDSECNHNYIENTIEPTCTTDGYVVYTCSKCGDTYTDYSEELKAKHTYEVIESIDSDCENDGLYIYQCINCDDIYIDEPSALGHDIVIQEAVSATCTEDGLTQGSYCSRCNTVFEKQQIIPATGHNNEIYRVTVTCEKSGYIIYKCSNCSKLETVKKDAYGHDYYFDHFENEELLVYICADCNNIKKMTSDEVLAIWRNSHINTSPVRANENQFLDVARDGFINGKDYAKIYHFSNFGW